MRIGIDFDNTIICYDGLFHRLALERGLIPESLPKDKTVVRDHIRAQGGEEDWILLQGLAYGAGIGGGAPFPGVCEFFEASRSQGHELFIISHKTRFPHKGEQVDLRKAALGWLLGKGLLDSGAALGRNLFFAAEREGKISRINECCCDVFIDDLPDFLGMEGFQEGVGLCLFDPGGNHGGYAAGPRFESWNEAREHLLKN